MKQIQLFILALLFCLPLTAQADQQHKQKSEVQKVENLTPQQIKLCKKYPHLCDDGPGCDDEDEEAPENHSVAPADHKNKDGDVL